MLDLFAKSSSARQDDYLRIGDTVYDFRLLVDVTKAVTYTRYVYFLRTIYVHPTNIQSHFYREQSLVSKNSNSCLRFIFSRKITIPIFVPSIRSVLVLSFSS